MLKPLIAAWICTCALCAGESLDLTTHSGRTLPPDAYRLLKKGGGRGSFSWSWKDPSFKANAGYTVEDTRWEWDTRQGQVLRYLRDQMELEARAGAPNKLSVRVVYFAVNSVGPTFILEGALSQDGKPKAYFVESVILDPGDALSGLVDEFMRDLTGFLR
jgi:hypothetical protein